MNRQGFTVVEVLIALGIVGLVVSSIVINNVRLAEMNSRAQVQTLEASAAEGIAQLYVNALPTGTVQGKVADALPNEPLDTSERAIWSVLNYTITNTGSTVQITIGRRDLTPDPNPLSIEVKP